MTRPTVGSIAEEVYASLAAYSHGDETRGWALLHLAEAIGMQNQLIRDVSFDTETHVGWSVLFDIDRCPAWALPYLGQFVGVRIPASLTDTEEQRAWIRDAAGWRRGRPAALVAAVRYTLTGGKHVVLRKRFDPGDPLVDSSGHIQIKTYTSETPDPDATERAAQLAKRGGLILHFSVVDGQDWLQLETNHATWNDVAAAYATWEDAADDIPI